MISKVQNISNKFFLYYGQACLVTTHKQKVMLNIPIEITFSTCRQLFLVRLYNKGLFVCE